MDSIITDCLYKLQPHFEIKFESDEFSQSRSHNKSYRVPKTHIARWKCFKIPILQILRLNNAPDKIYLNN